MSYKDGFVFEPDKNHAEWEEFRVWWNNKTIPPRGLSEAEWAWAAWLAAKRSVRAERPTHE